MALLTQTLESFESLSLIHIYPAAYDGVIVGGSIRMGRLHRKAREFMTLHQKTLLRRPLCCFVCCAFADRAQEYIEKEFPPDLLDHACLLYTSRCV